MRASPPLGRNDPRRGTLFVFADSTDDTHYPHGYTLRIKGVNPFIQWNYRWKTVDSFSGEVLNANRGVYPLSEQIAQMLTCPFALVLQNAASRWATSERPFLF